MSTRQPLSAPEKEFLYRRKQAGASHAEVARELGCARETVRKHWQAYRRDRQPRKRGRPARGILSSYPVEVADRAVALKQAHPHHGPANILLDLRQQYAGRLPSPSRLSALFKARCPQAVQPWKRRPRPAAPPPLTIQAHQRWQVDAKEKIRLRSGDFASILDVRDPAGALMIAAQAFETTLTASTYRKLTLAEIQATLRTAFEAWGRPAEIQTDHENVYAGANQSDFPMPFTLWLVGLGIQHYFSRERCPTDQPQIERNHRTLAEMSWKDQPPTDLADLQQQLDTCRTRYNQQFPAHAADCQGQPPLVCHPQATTSGRPYARVWEAQLFNLDLVDQYLAQARWVRKADLHGVVFLGNRPYCLGKGCKGQRVRIQFLPADRCFHFQTEPGEPIAVLPAQGLDESDLIGPDLDPVPLALPLQLPLPWVGV